MGVYEQNTGATDEWYTPHYVFAAMACWFDVDVASPGGHVTPWIPASRFIVSDSLNEQWDGLVWMNPPFGRRNGLVPWLKRFISHGNGVALVPDRTSAPWWRAAAPQMDGLLFVSPKIKFIGADQKAGAIPAQGTTLMAMGFEAVAALRRADQHGLGVFAVTRV